MNRSLNLVCIQNLTTAGRWLQPVRVLAAKPALATQSRSANEAIAPESSQSPAPRCTSRLARTLLALVELDSREHTRGMQMLASLGLSRLVHQRIADQLATGRERPSLTDMQCLVDQVQSRLSTVSLA